MRKTSISNVFTLHRNTSHSLVSTIKEEINGKKMTRNKSASFNLLQKVRRSTNSTMRNIDFIPKMNEHVGMRLTHKRETL
jgi:hypothetical protein